MIDENLHCPYCGGVLIWDSDSMSEEVGYAPENKIVSYYHCVKCGATAEFMEGGE